MQLFNQCSRASLSPVWQNLCFRLWSPQSPS